MNKTIKNKLDRVFSEFIRLRDSDNNGYCKCISCGTIKHWKEVDCGHYINRKHLSTRWDERNCHAQCRACNRFDEGNIPAYTLSIQKKLSKNIVELLLFKKQQICKLSDVDGKFMIENYKKEVARMKSLKL